LYGGKECENRWRDIDRDGKVILDDRGNKCKDVTAKSRVHEM